MNDMSGPLLLLTVIGLFALSAYGTYWVFSRLFRVVDRHDRRRAMERQMRQAVEDADLQQQIARKLLDERTR